MQFQTPEQAGISSRCVLAFLKELEDKALATHAVILSRGDRIFAEGYFSPMREDTLHRMYSTSKSFVSVAVGLCVQEGLVSLSDPIAKYFPDYADSAAFHQTTVEEMLQMRTTQNDSGHWFRDHPTDRVAHYFSRQEEKLSGTAFHYDSEATFVLGAMVERVTGKPFLEYMKEKILSKIGFSAEATCLQCPGGHSWGDSGILCTARDLWRFARFVQQEGVWQGQRLMDGAYLRKATTLRLGTEPYGFETAQSFGYGYQFWGGPEGSVVTLGMGCQISLFHREKDLTFVILSNNQGSPIAAHVILDALRRHVLSSLGAPLPPDPRAAEELEQYLNTRKVYFLPERERSSWERDVADREYRCRENRCHWKRFSLHFTETGGLLRYENEQGEKELSFGFGRNEFGLFPQEGYADLVGNTPTRGVYYRCGVSAHWCAEDTLRLRVQILDRYLGNLAILFAFRSPEEVTVRFARAAEDFLQEYEGTLDAVAQ